MEFRYRVARSVTNVSYLLSDGILHRVSGEPEFRQKGLGFSLCVAPPHDCVVPNFRVMEIMEVFRR